MMYRLFTICLITMLGVVACTKTESSNAHVLFYNGSWSIPTITAAWNSNSLFTTALAQGQSSGTSLSPYLNVPAGTNLITLKAGNDTLINKNIYSTASSGTSFLFYDTSAAAAPAKGVLQLTDDLTQPDTAQLKYRFIDLSPDTTAAADVWFVKGVTDSIRLDSAALFIGKNATAAAVQTFATMKYHGEAYTIKIKKTGTQTLYASIPNYSFATRGIYSIIFSGLSAGAGNAGFKLSVLHHFTQ